MSKQQKVMVKREREQVNRAGGECHREGEGTAKRALSYAYSPAIPGLHIPSGSSSFLAAMLYTDASFQIPPLVTPGTG